MQGVFALDFECRVDASKKTLSSGLFVTTGSVDLTRKIEVLDVLGF